MVKKILIVEDDIRGAQILEKTVRICGHEPTVLQTRPIDAISLIRQRFESTRYDLVVIDGMNGMWRRTAEYLDKINANYCMYTNDREALSQARESGISVFEKDRDFEFFVNFLEG